MDWSKDLVIAEHLEIDISNEIYHIYVLQQLFFPLKICNIRCVEFRYFYITQWVGKFKYRTCQMGWINFKGFSFLKFFPFSKKGNSNSLGEGLLKFFPWNLS